MTLVLLQIVLILFSDIYGCEDVDTHNGIILIPPKKGE
jgi:hypothetical protein